MIQGIVTTLQNSKGHTKYYIIEGLMRKINKKGNLLTTEITSLQFYELQKAGYLYVYNQDFDHYYKEINKLRNKLNT